MKALNKLKQLKGVYRRSLFDRIFHYAMAVVLAAGGGKFIGIVRDEYHRQLTLGLTPKVPYLAIGLGICFIAFGFFWLQRAGMKYEFQNGMVRAISPTGRPIWEGNLLEATEIKKTWSKMATFLVISFPDKKRRLELFGSLQDDLDDENLDD